MLHYLATSSDGGRDLLASPGAADLLWEAVAQEEPMTAVRSICDALAQSVGRRPPHCDRLRALFTFDRHSQLLLERLLLRFAAVSADLPLVERQVRHAVFELSRAYAQGYSHYLRHIRDKRPGKEWIDGIPAILVRLFYHRQIELLLHLFRYEPWPRGRWRELHDAYRWGRRERAPAIVTAGSNGERQSSISPETMYTRVLLTQLLDSGQFLAPELAAARKWIGRWSRLVSLRAWTRDGSSTTGFIVDISGADGLKRPPAGHPGEWLWLDSTPIALAIDEDLAAAEGSTPTSRARRQALLSRLKVVYAPRATRIERRGERDAAALTSVQATIGGLASIFSMLRNESRRAAGTVPAPVGAAYESLTVSDTREHSGAPAVAGGSFEDSLSPFPVTASFGVPQLSWQVRDRSRSGSRLRGRVSNPRRTVPGSLTAFRDDEHTPWTLAVVRRLKRLPGSNVEIGVEHLGRNPQPVVLLALQLSAAGAKRERFPALYLRGGAFPVNSLVKTLVLPATQFEPGRLLAMIATGKEVHIRLKESIEHQTDFVWALFELADSPRPIV